MGKVFHRIAGLAAVLTMIGAGTVQAQILSDDGEEPSVGLTEDRGVIPEREGSGLSDQVDIGTVEDEQVLAGEDEGQPRGAGVGLRENESDIGEVPRGPAPGLERDD